MRGREILRVLLSSGSGRAGALFLLLLIGVSAYVVLTYPSGFGLRLWNNPAAWADNPKNAPPAWAALFSSGEEARHRVFQAARPTAEAGGMRLYTFPFAYGEEEPPSFFTFSIREVVYHSQPPLITVSLSRPDGRDVVLYRQVVAGPGTGEALPIVRYKESPLRVHLSSEPSALEAASALLPGERGREASPLRLEEALFGIPGPQGFQTLQGNYQVTIRVLTYHPADSIGGVKAVVGGTVYGAMGTDSLGRDLARGLLFGFPVALLIGASTAFLATLIGTVLGIISGYAGGHTDTLIQRSCDVLTNVPLLPILIFLIFILGQKLWLVVGLLVAFGWPGLTIVTRPLVLQLRTGQLVEATQALGASRWRVMFRHILFQIAPFLLAQMVFFTPAAILAEAGLSFLGLGDPSIPTWGQILEHGFRTGAVYIGYWWWVLPPGLLIMATAMVFMLLTLGLEPVVNPRLRSG